ncbi:TolC family protein [Mariprofundus sp. EBB-1]|nr:TolC family protein [Mariprofundus sp. EBB-1]
MSVRTYILDNYNLVMNKPLLLTLLLMTAGSANAVEISSLRQGVDYALAHNRMLAMDNSSVDQSRANQDLVKSQFMPRLDLSTGVVRTDAPGRFFGTKLNQQRIKAADFTPAFLNNPGFINNYQTRLNINMPLYQGGAMWAGKEQADHDVEASELQHEYMQQQIVFQTIHAYTRARQAKAAIQAMQAAVNAAEKRYQDTLVLEKRGVLIASDVMDARVHLLRSELKFKQANNIYAHTLELLQRVLALDSDARLNVDGEPELATAQMTLAEALEKSLQQRVDLKAMEASYRASKAGVDASKATFLPRVDLVAGQEWNASTPALKNRNSMIGATVSMNLFSGGADRARLRASRAKEMNMAYKISDLKQQIHNEVTQAWRMLDESKISDASEREALKQSEESLRIKSLRYQQGLAKTSDLLDAQLQVDTTRLASIRAKYDVTIAKAVLQLAVGTLNEKIIQ